MRPILVAFTAGTEPGRRSRHRRRETVTSTPDTAISTGASIGLYFTAFVDEIASRPLDLPRSRPDLGGPGVIDGDDTSSPSPSSSSSSSGPGSSGSTAGKSGPGAMSGGHAGETVLTGDTAQSVKDAVTAKYPGATFVRVETDSDGVYEAHLTKADGTSTTVELDKAFAITGDEAGGAGGHGGHGGRANDNDPDDAPAALALVQRDPVQLIRTSLGPAPPVRGRAHRHVHPPAGTEGDSIDSASGPAASASDPGIPSSSSSVCGSATDPALSLIHARGPARTARRR